MNKRLLIFTLFITCVYTTSLFAQDRLGVLSLIHISEPTRP